LAIDIPDFSAACGVWASAGTVLTNNQKQTANNIAVTLERQSAASKRTSLPAVQIQNIKRRNRRRCSDDRRPEYRNGILWQEVVDNSTLIPAEFDRSAYSGRQSVDGPGSQSG